MNIEFMKTGGGNITKDQMIIWTDKGQMFKSYNSNIAFRDNKGNITLGKDWNYSNTTGKYRNIFLRETKKVTEQKIKAGIYKIDENL